MLSSAKHAARVALAETSQTQVSLRDLRLGGSALAIPAFRIPAHHARNARRGLEFWAFGEVESS